MSSFLGVLLISFIITILLVLFETDDKKDKTSYGIKVFIISFITIYFGLSFINDDIKHQISTGEPPF